MYDDIALELAEACHGVTSTHRLKAKGVTADEIKQLGRSRQWERPTGVVFRRIGSAPTVAQEVAIAVLDAGPQACLSHLPSANRWGLDGCALRPLDVVGTSSSRRRSDLVRFHKVRRLPDDWTTELDGIPIVRPELCALQLFSVCTYERIAEQLTESLWSNRLLSGPSLRKFIADMGEMGRNGTAGVRRYLDDRPGDYTPSASNLETRVGQILRNAGIEVRRQIDTGSDQRWTGRVDFLVVGVPVVIEVQSQKYHAALVDRRADAARRAGLEAAGFTWVEVWDDDVWSAPWRVVAAVRDGRRRARSNP